MKKTLILNVLLLIVSTSLIAQNTLVGGNNYSDTRSVVVNNGIWVTNPPVKKEIKGTPYLFDNWNNKSQIYIQDRVYDIPSFNYNIRSERFEAKFSEDSLLIINPRYIKKIVINNKVFKRYLDPEFERNSYFEEIIDVNETTIVKKYIIKFQEGNLNPMTQQKISPDKFLKNEQYYLKDNENELKLIKLKKSTILSLVQSDKRTIIKNYSKEKKLKFNKIDDVIRLLNFYKTI